MPETSRVPIDSFAQLCKELRRVDCSFGRIEQIAFPENAPSALRLALVEHTAPNLRIEPILARAEIPAEFS